MLDSLCIRPTIRDAPFDFWGGGLDYYFKLWVFFSEKLAHNFFFTPTLEQTFFLSLESK